MLEIDEEVEDAAPDAAVDRLGYWILTEGTS